MRDSGRRYDLPGEWQPVRLTGMGEDRRSATPLLCLRARAGAQPAPRVRRQAIASVYVRARSRPTGSCSSGSARGSPAPERTVADAERP